MLVRSRSARGIEYLKYFEIGDPKKPCLSLIIYTKNAIDMFDKEIIKTAKLSNIESLYECVLEENAPELFEKYSFSQELLNFIINYLKINYPYVKNIQLDDESYIPCNRESNETLDLLTYSIALYGKTWYERVYNAKLSNDDDYKEYRKQVDKYISEEFKNSISWEKFLLIHFNTASHFGHNFMKENIDQIKEVYENSKIFPDFFTKIRDIVGTEDKCKFFKSWLQQFINSIIKINRRWIIIIRSEGGKRRTKKQKTSAHSLLPSNAACTVKKNQKPSLYKASHFYK
jgi:hypothetical protein